MILEFIYLTFQKKSFSWRACRVIYPAFLKRTPHHFPLLCFIHTTRTPVIVLPRQGMGVDNDYSFGIMPAIWIHLEQFLGKTNVGPARPSCLRGEPPQVEEIPVDYPLNLARSESFR